MKFTELEQLMFSKGVKTLADIARVLNTTPQAVSNWKARDQVPYKVMNEIQNKFLLNDDSVDMSPDENTKMKKIVNFANNDVNTNSYGFLSLLLMSSFSMFCFYF